MTEPVCTAGGARARGSLAAPAFGLCASVVTLFVGGWLLLTPYASGRQPAGISWTDATTTNFDTGIGVAAASLVVLVATATQLVVRLRALPPARTAAPVGGDAEAAVTASALAPLAAALLADLDRAARHDDAEATS